MQLVRTSSSIGRMLVHVCFIVKYRHKVFRDFRLKQRCEALLREAASRAGIVIDSIGFDVDHVHMVVDIGLRSMAEVAKLLKGYSGYKLLREFADVKTRYFWGSGFWSPAYYFRSVGQNYAAISSYVANQPLNTTGL